MHGDNHALVLAAMTNVAATYSARGRTDNTSPLLKSTIEISTATTGGKSRDTLYLRSKYMAAVPQALETESLQVVDAEETMGQLQDRME